jgi:hypothetical protein
MRSLSLAREAVTVCPVAAIMTSCGPLGQAKGDTPPLIARNALPPAWETERSGQPTHRAAPFLYVGSGWPLLSEYALDSSKPLRTVKPQYGAVATALDSFGDLIAETGFISHGFVSVYDARSLKYLRGIDGVWAVALAADRDGYIYAADCGDGIDVLVPGGTKEMHVIYQHGRVYVSL